MGAINECQLHIAYSRRLDDQLAALAQEEETTKSDLVRRAIREFLARHQPQKAGLARVK